jgi:hypothetical protein
MYLLLSTLACQVMDQPGHAFVFVKIADLEITEEPTIVEVSEKDVDPMFDDPQEEIISMGTKVPAVSEEASEEPVDSEIVEDQIPIPTEEVVAAQVVLDPMTVPENGWRRATVKDGWRPTLIGVMMEGPTPRAVLTMPSGQETVVRAGDMLSDEGFIVMSIGASFVELAVIQSSEGRAVVENLTLRPQFQ